MLKAFAWMGSFVPRFLKRRDGSAAVEFALVSLPFFMLLLGIFETSAVYFADSTLENAVDDASRKIRTGQVQIAGTTADQFRQMICDEIDMLLSCDDSLVVDVRSFSEFQDVTFPSPLGADGTFNGTNEYDPGSAGDIVLVRAFYSWKITTPLIGATLANMADNQRLIVATATFRNEPFGSVLGE